MIQRKVSSGLSGNHEKHAEEYSTAIARKGEHFFFFFFKAVFLEKNRSQYFQHFEESLNFFSINFQRFRKRYSSSKYYNKIYIYSWF